MSLLESSAISLKPAIKSNAPEQTVVAAPSGNSNAESSEKPFKQHFQEEVDNQVKQEQETMPVELLPVDDHVATPVITVLTEQSPEEELPVSDIQEEQVAEIPDLITGNNLPVIETDRQIAGKPVAETVTEPVMQIAIKSRPGSAGATPSLPKGLSQMHLTDSSPDNESAEPVVLDMEVPEIIEELNGQLMTKQKPQFEAQMSTKSELIELVKMTRGAVAQSPASVVTDSSLKSLNIDSSTQSLPLNTPLQQKQWGNEFAQRISMLVNNGQQQVAEMRLNPARLGSIGVRIQIEDDKANISFVTSHQSVKEAIEVSLPRLKDQLEQQGLDLGDVDVSARDSEQAGADSDKEFSQFQNDFNSVNGEKTENAEILETSLNFETSNGVSVFV